MANLTERIRQIALELGFDDIGIVPATALDTEGAHLFQWLGAGHHGEMSWMARDPEKRTDPRKIFPDARSVVVVTLNYYSPETHSETPGMGKISRYAWGDDYHDIIREKLKKLLDLVIDEVPEADGKICVDTAPMMDKAWAVRAGLGWIGKHTNLITTSRGSWVFIGELILNIDLEDDIRAVEDHCGTCTACIDACPTDAIVEPYVVDSRKCISYATIELRDDVLPANIADNQSGWLYGCDICQDVCPWNRFQSRSDEAAFTPRHGESELALDNVLALTPEAYAERFRGSAMKRTKLIGLKRNALSLKQKAGQH